MFKYDFEKKFFAASKTHIPKIDVNNITVIMIYKMLYLLNLLTIQLI